MLVAAAGLCGGLVRPLTRPTPHAPTSPRCVRDLAHQPLAGPLKSDQRDPTPFGHTAERVLSNVLSNGNLGALGSLVVLGFETSCSPATWSPTSCTLCLVGQLLTPRTDIGWGLT
jgi:hypothetical protein